MDGEPAALADYEIEECLKSLSKLLEHLDTLIEKTAMIGNSQAVEPFFIKRSMAGIYRSQAIITEMLLRVMVTLRDGVEDPPEEPRDPSRQGRPRLRIVEPD
ncbi:hypothetical protein MXD81_49010 [Microbacteriaceae bacterium K1510]|nr:hypothetical protein [Microbacteriaceae bacterium K1510]